jgi:DMSO/TMAO reductase YedYZ molybdopterin-dependent catalytic subunit
LAISLHDGLVAESQASTFLLSGKNCHILRLLSGQPPFEAQRQSVMPAVDLFKERKDQQMYRQSLPVIVLVVGILLTGCASQRAVGNPVVGLTASPLMGEAGMSGTPLSTETEMPTVMPVPETKTPAETPTGRVGDIVSSCGQSAIIEPTMAPNPGMNALDKTTGLHVTGHAMSIDLATYRLKVSGLVDHPLSLSYNTLRCMPKVTARLDLVCPAIFEDGATWSGVPLEYILKLAGIQNGANVITLVAADGYESQVYIQTALEDKNFLAYEWNGQPVPVLHGFPLRAVFPGLPGSNWVKWLLEIKVE